MTERRLVRPDDFPVQAGRLGQPVAAISIDVESDYNSRQHEALDRLGDLLATTAALEVPLTAFVEGQFFENRPQIPERLVAAGADVQLHCYDHLGPGDRPEDLARSVEAYTGWMGRPPEGYRAHTYRLTRELLAALIAHRFKWDSSILPARAQGGNARWAADGADYWVIDGRLVELPLATWPRVGLPLIHSYRLMLRPLGEAVVRRAVGLPGLIVYDMHMADLVWSSSLKQSPLPAHVKLLYRYMWGRNRGDSFASLRGFVERLRAEGYELVTLGALRDRIVSGEADAPPR